MGPRIFFLITVSVGLTGNLIFSPFVLQTIEQKQLKPILEKTCDYCEKLKGLALHFVCEEKIQEKTYTFNKTWAIARHDKMRGYKLMEDLKVDKVNTKSYVYDYQMIKKGEEFKEKRNLLSENGKKRREQDVELKTMRMSSKFLVFGPVGFLSQYWQKHFNYEIIGFENIGHSRAIVLRASPKKLTAENNNFGKIWVDETDSSILKIEWEPQSIVGFEEKANSSLGELKRKISWTVSYDIVHNGVRFPSQQLIKEAYITENGREHTKYEALYIYDNYKYFVVETEVIW
jgi:outer membrane lipoprotein-sorting protein